MPLLPFSFGVDPDGNPALLLPENIFSIYAGDTVLPMRFLSWTDSGSSVDHYVFDTGNDVVGGGRHTAWHNNESEIGYLSGTGSLNLDGNVTIDGYFRSDEGMYMPTTQTPGGLQNDTLFRNTNGQIEGNFGLLFGDNSEDNAGMKLLLDKINSLFQVGDPDGLDTEIYFEVSADEEWMKAVFGGSDLLLLESGGATLNGLFTNNLSGSTPAIGSGTIAQFNNRGAASTNAYIGVSCGNDAVAAVLLGGSSQDEVHLKYDADTGLGSIGMGITDDLLQWDTKQIDVTSGYRTNVVTITSSTTLYVGSHQYFVTGNGYTVTLPNIGGETYIGTEYQLYFDDTISKSPITISTNGDLIYGNSSELGHVSGASSVSINLNNYSIRLKALKGGYWAIQN